MTIKVCKWCEMHYVASIDDKGFCSIECETIFHEQKAYEKETHPCTPLDRGDITKEATNDNTRTD